MGDAWYDGKDTRVSNGIVYRRLPHSFYSLENPPKHNVVQMMFDNCDLDQHFKAVYSPDKERLYSFDSLFMPGNRVHISALIETYEGKWLGKTEDETNAIFGAGLRIQPIIFVPESLYDILVTPLVEVKSLRALALQGVRKIAASDLNDASECRELFGDNIWVRDYNYPRCRAAQAKFYKGTEDYGPYYVARFDTDWRSVELKISEPNETICIFGMPEERIQEFIETLKPHNGIKFVNSNTVSLMSGSTSAKTAFIAHHSVRDWAA